MFEQEKYQQAAEKALAFILRQMDGNRYTLFPRLEQTYPAEYTKRIYATVEMPADAVVRFPNYCWCDRFYGPDYTGVCSGHHQNTGEARLHLGLEISTTTDQKYRSAVCFLHEDGTWRSETYYKEIDYDHQSIHWYKKDKLLNESGSNGVKSFALKYYKWVDELGSEIDLDHLPTTQSTWPEGKTGLVTYTVRPVLLDDEAVDDAVPEYPEYEAVQYNFSDVEYKTCTAPILYDGPVTAKDLPAAPPQLPALPEPYIRDAIVQPGADENEVLLTWITNFEDACTLECAGSTQQVTGRSVAAGYFTYHAALPVKPGASYTYTIRGKNAGLTKQFTCPDSSTYLVCGDPQIIAADSAAVWYRVQDILPEPPALILSLGDQVDAITDAALRKVQYHLFTSKHRVPIATVRGNHDRNEHYLAHYGTPNGESGNYWFLHGSTLFIAINSNTVDPSAHKAFIRAALKKPHTWAVLLMHHSLYSTSTRALVPNTTALRSGLTDFLVKETDIDLILSGHEHFFCRTDKPGKLFVCCPTCTGSKYYEADNKGAAWAQVTIDKKAPGYLVLQTSDTALTLKTYDLENTLLDSCTVTK